MAYKDPRALNRITVAKGGADFETIQAAINSITDASASKPYAVQVTAGVYVENLVHKEYVSVVGDLASSPTIIGRHTLAHGSTLLTGLTLVYTQTEADKPMFQNVSGSSYFLIDMCFVGYVATAVSPQMVKLTDCSFSFFRSAATISVTNSLGGTQDIISVAGSGVIEAVIEIDATATVSGADIALFSSSVSGQEIIGVGGGSRLNFAVTGASKASVIRYHGAAAGSKTILSATMTLAGTTSTEGSAVIVGDATGLTVKMMVNRMNVSGFTTNYAYDVSAGNIIDTYFDVVSASGYYTGSGTVDLNGQPAYGGAGVTGGGNFAILKVNDWHGYTDSVDTGVGQNTTVRASGSGTITAFANGGTGITTVTSNGHGNLNGDIVTIVNSTNYSGVYVVANASTNAYDIAKAYVATESGPTWLRPTQVILGARGAYESSFVFGTQCSVNNKDFEFQLYKNATPLPYSKMPKSYSVSASTSTVSGQAQGTFEKSDRIWFGLRNITDAVDLTISEGVMTVKKIN